jgi:hypothetical protein
VSGSSRLRIALASTAGFLLVGASIFLGVTLTTGASAAVGSHSDPARSKGSSSGASAKSKANDRADKARTFLTSTDNLPPDCIPKSSGPPGSPYELGLVGTVTNGTLTAGPATVTNITAKFCGIVTLVNGKQPCGATGTVYVPPDGVIFGPLTAQLTLIPGMQPKVPFTAKPGSITGGFICESNNSGLLVTTDAHVSGVTGLYGLACTIGPLTIPLTGTLTGPLGDASVTLRSNDFTVPAVGSASTCPGDAPAQLDQIAGLPIAPGGASATLSATVSLYQPG